MTEIEEFFNLRNRFAPWHTARYLASLRWLDGLLQNGASVLDLGGRSVFPEAVQKFYDVKIKMGVSFDLRYRFPFDDDEFNLVLCMEVLEHICDRGDSRIDIFTGSGITNLASEVQRILMPGGHLFLSTPNVCCYNSIWRMLKGEHPYSYQPHFRELALADVTRLIGIAGLEVVRCEQVEIWNQHKVPQEVIDKIDELAASLGCETARGDCIFMLAVKR